MGRGRSRQPLPPDCNLISTAPCWRSLFPNRQLKPQAQRPALALAQHRAAAAAVHRRFELRSDKESAEEAKYSRIRGLVLEELKVGRGGGVGGREGQGVGACPHLSHCTLLGTCILRTRWRWLGLSASRSPAALHPLGL